MAIKDWQEIQGDYETMQNMSCIPCGIKKVSQNYIFNENKSVKWNKDMVIKNNTAYQEEVARLNREKNKVRDAIHEDIYKAIQNEVGHSLSRNGARKIWEYAYAQGRAYGIYSIMQHLREAIDLIMEVFDS
ncbi:MAG: hypothetical protein LIO41_07520 [Ruminococcus sp.]|nr:hypothetical protein [Oscillospiraceae bacterium]MCC8192866.1 hypothetical protein [Ruminococcus sp.]